MITIGPLWVLNFVLLCLHFFIFVFFVLSNHITDVTINWKSQDIKEIELLKSKSLDFDFIKKKDIFQTKQPIIEKKKIYSYQPVSLVTVQSVPSLPLEIPITQNVANEKEMLPPLQIALHGTLITENPMNNKVFIENINNKQEKEYGIGDTIEDSQIIFINKNKVIFVRSNGQEESIFLNKNFKLEEEVGNNLPWNNIIYYNNEDNTYYVDITLFKTKISSYSDLIHEIGLSTAFDKNYPIGCKIQKIYPNSLPDILHINTDDIIIKVNNININTPENRMLVLNQINDNENNNNILVLSLEVLNNKVARTIHLKCYKNDKEIKIKKVGFFKVFEEKNKERPKNE